VKKSLLHLAMVDEPLWGAPSGPARTRRLHLASRQVRGTLSRRTLQPASTVLAGASVWHIGPPPKALDKWR
jgi:hypothetical protein